MFKLTPVVRNLVIINVMVFFALLIMPGLAQYLVVFGFQSPHFKPYQLFTYMFTHLEFLHIFFNMLVLATTGPILENFWGQKKFLIFYLVTGIGAAVFHQILSMYVYPEAANIPMLGASGAGYGILMAFGMMFPNMEVMLLLPPVPIKAKYMVWVMGVMTLFINGTQGVAHFAHLGGIIFAFILLRIWRSQDGSYF